MTTKLALVFTYRKLNNFDFSVLKEHELPQNIARAANLDRKQSNETDHKYRMPCDNAILQFCFSKIYRKHTLTHSKTFQKFLCHGIDHMFSQVNYHFICAWTDKRGISQKDPLQLHCCIQILLFQLWITMISFLVFTTVYICREGKYTDYVYFVEQFSFNFNFLLLARRLNAFVCHIRFSHHHEASWTLFKRREKWLMLWTSIFGLWKLSLIVTHNHHIINLLGNFVKVNLSTYSIFKLHSTLRNESKIHIRNSHCCIVRNYCKRL